MASAIIDHSLEAAPLVSQPPDSSSSISCVVVRSAHIHGVVPFRSYVRTK